MDTTNMYHLKLVKALCLLIDGYGRWRYLFFFLSEYRIVSHSAFACNWQNRFLDSELVVACFPSNKGRNLDI